MKLKPFRLKELSRSEIEKINGGTFNYFGYAMGYVVGKTVAMVKGAYASGHDAAQNNCECNKN